MHRTDQRSVVGRKETGLLHTSQRQLPRAPSQGPYKLAGCRPAQKPLKRRQQLQLNGRARVMLATSWSTPCTACHWKPHNSG